MNHLNPPTSDFDPVGSSFTNQVKEVKDGQILQAREAGNITVINTVVRPRPIQLPELPAHHPKLEHLHAVHREADVDQGQIIVLHGPPGSGKTQLAAHLLHQNLDRFTNGILVADLQGSNPAGPADPNSVLDHFPRTIHVGAEAIPTDFGTRSAAWRSYTYGREVAVLADDALSAAQVRSLIPGRGPHLVVVTARAPLMSLRLDGADLVEIDHPTSPPDQGAAS